MEEERDSTIPEQRLDFKEWNGIDEMESLCMSCGENGVTRFLLHKIPSFRELVLASFYCDHCGERNNEVTFGGEIQAEGCNYELHVEKPKDLNRQVIKADSASVFIKDLDFEIPPNTQKGSINTIEGLLKRAANDLDAYQPLRRIQVPEVAEKLDLVINRLNEMANGEYLPFTMSINDPAGNSFIENPLAPQNDPQLTYTTYHRTADQDRAIGLDPAKDSFKNVDIEPLDNLLQGKKIFGGELQPAHEQLLQTEEMEILGRTEAISIPSLCPSCQCEGESLTALTNIPHFKEIIIMSFLCKLCGYRNSDVKGGGAVPTFGSEVRLHVTSVNDLKR
jgi:zinc finger protein